MRIQRLLSSLVLLLPLQTFAEVYEVSNIAELREAASAAATNEEENTIQLRSGVYDLSSDGLGPISYNASHANLLTIEGDSSGSVVLDGNTKSQILRHKTLGRGPLTLINLKIINGYNDGDGGAISSESSLTLTNVEFERNVSDGRGGAIYIYKGGTDASASLTIENSKFDGNEAQTGGAIYFYQGYRSDLSVSNSRFNRNKAVDSGGAIYKRSIYRGDQNITSSEFVGNEAGEYGGAIWHFADYSFSRLQINIDQSLFSENSAERHGSAIYGAIDAKITITINNSIFSNHSENAESVLHGMDFLITNTGFSEASDVIYIKTGDQNRIYNSYFVGAGEVAIQGEDTAALKMGYSFLGSKSVEMESYFPESLLDTNSNAHFEDLAGGNFRLNIDSDFIDRGTTNENSVTLTDYDYTGTTARVIGASVDIGPYEYDGEAPPDSDGDGLNDNIDNCPNIYNEDQADFDSDGEGDVCDSDDDNDGTNDEDDAFPFDDTESLDTDGDGIGNNEDYDDDADGILDSFDNAPLVVNAIVVDSDNDGVIDSVDAYPNDPTKQYSGTGDLDGDGYSNDEEVDYCSNPFDKNSQPDIGGLSLPMIHLLTEQ